MESILKKFEKNSIDMSNVYGGLEVYTGKKSVGDLSGEEYAYINGDCVQTVVFGENGIIFNETVC